MMQNIIQNIEITYKIVVTVSYTGRVDKVQRCSLTVSKGSTDIILQLLEDFSICQILKDALGEFS